MEEIPQNPRNTYELMENDKGEIVAFIFADDTAPNKPTFYLDEKEKFIELNRTSDNVVYIEGLEPETIEKLKKITKLYVCEMAYEENGENKIAYVYAAELKEHPQKEFPQQQNKVQEISEKAKKAREKLLKNKSSDVSLKEFQKK